MYNVERLMLKIAIVAKIISIEEDCIQFYSIAP
jgi:hypothetical protein